MTAGAIPEIIILSSMVPGAKPKLSYLFYSPDLGLAPLAIKIHLNDSYGATSKGLRYVKNETQN